VQAIDRKEGQDKKEREEKEKLWRVQFSGGDIQEISTKHADKKGPWDFGTGVAPPESHSSVC